MSLNLISNYAANLANRITDQTDRRLTSTLTKLSTGSRITRASDDASGLVLGNTFRTELAALQTVQTNVAQATSMIQIADGAHQSVTDICIRMKALAVMCASQSLNDSDRAAVDVEFQELKAEINRIAYSTTFAGNVLTGGPGGGVPTKSFTMADAMLPYFGSVKVYGPERCTDDAAKLRAAVSTVDGKQFVTLTDAGRNVSQRIEVIQNKPLDFTALGIVIQPTSTFPMGNLVATAFKSVTLGSTDGGVMHIDPGSALSFVKEIYAYDTNAISNDPARVSFQITSSAAPVAQVSRVSIGQPTTNAVAGDTVSITVNGTRITTQALAAGDDEADMAAALAAAINANRDVGALVEASVAPQRTTIEIAAPSTAAGAGDTAFITVNGTKIVTAALQAGASKTAIAAALATAINANAAAGAAVTASAADGTLILDARSASQPFTSSRVGFTGSLAAADVLATQKSVLSIGAPTASASAGDTLAITINGTAIQTAALAGGESDAGIAAAIVAAINANAAVGAAVTATLGKQVSSLKIDPPSVAAAANDTVSVKVNGTTVTATLAGSETATAIAQRLAIAINASNAVNGAVVAAAADGTLRLTARASGTIVTLSALSTTGSVAAQSAVSAQKAQFTIGAPSTAASASDTVSVTVNGTTVSATLSGGENRDAIATALATAINANATLGNVVSASASAGGSLTLIARQAGTPFDVSDLDISGTLAATVGLVAQGPAGEIALASRNGTDFTSSGLSVTGALAVASSVKASGSLGQLSLVSKFAGKPFQVADFAVNGTVVVGRDISTKTQNTTPTFQITARSTEPNVTQTIGIGQDFGSQLFDFRELGIRLTTTADFDVTDVVDRSGIKANLAAGQNVASISKDNNLVSYFYQVGSGSSSTDQIQVDVTSLTTRALGLEFLTLAAHSENGVARGGTENSRQANAVLESTLLRISTNRAKLGAKMNRLEFVSDSLRISQENNEEARSSIMDADTAQEMTRFTSQQILREAGIAMISQAQKLPQSLLSLYAKL